MTVEVHGSAPSSPWGDLGDVGLEDAGAADISMPRIQIMHAEGRFRDASTTEEMEVLDCVILGLIKQRIMWDSVVDDNDKPQCKSPDFKVGFPQMRTDIPARKQFPWSKSNFDPKDFPPNADGQIVLPCESCTLKDWGTDKSKPLCSEQYTFALYYRGADGIMRPGLISFQRSAMKACRAYTGSFAAAKQPMFTVYTQISLREESRGRTVYSVPVFTRGGSSESEMWPGYAEQYRGIREYLHQPPRPATKEADEEAASSAPARPAPASATKATELKDDDPWASSAPSAAPAAAASPDDDLPF